MENLPGGRPETRYVETPLGYVAYQVFGSGDRDILFVTGGISNIDAIWDEPTAVRFFDRLGRMGRVIQRDMRGSGVSDPIAGETIYLPLEDNAADLVAVLDAAGSEQAVVYGDTEGGLTALMLAATKPERVAALVLVNCIPSVRRSEDYPIGMPPEVAESLSDQYVAQHGTTGAILDLTAPSVAQDLRFRRWWTRYERLSVPLGLVRRTFDWFSQADVRALLPQIRVPALVVGRREARYHRLAYSQYVAEHIEGAVLRVLDGADTLPFHAGDFNQVLDVVEEFLTGGSDSPRADRSLATVLLTDIVGSTAMASSMGDRRWLDLLAEHDRIARAQLARFRGREIKMTGDGCLATFDGPGRAVACAASMVDLMAAVGIPLRAGVHTGEVEFRVGDIGGLGVHIASRVMAEAVSGGVLVSSTVKDLTAGSGFRFRPCGSFSLKGVPGEWQLFELESLG
jgi:class 3 adenylate cyclase